MHVKREGVEEKEDRGGTREMERGDKNEEGGKQRVLRSKRGARDGAREKREREKRRRGERTKGDRGEGGKTNSKRDKKKERENIE